MSVAVETTNSLQLSSAGKLLFQAAKEGNTESLRALLELPGGTQYKLSSVLTLAAVLLISLDS